MSIIPIPPFTNYVTYDLDSQTNKDLIDVFKTNPSIITPAPFSTGYKVGSYDLSQIFVKSAGGAQGVPDADQIDYNTNYITNYNNKDLRFLFQRYGFVSDPVTYTGASQTISGNNYTIINTSATGTITFNVDINNVTFTLIGGGGSGGLTIGGDGSYPYGAGGGEGGATTQITQNMSSGASSNFTVGSGGMGAGPNYNGGNTTIFGHTVNGGVSGGNGSVVSGGLGGVGTGAQGGNAVGPSQSVTNGANGSQYTINSVTNYYGGGGGAGGSSLGYVGSVGGQGSDGKGGDGAYGLDNQGGYTFGGNGNPGKLIISFTYP